MAVRRRHLRCTLSALGRALFPRAAALADCKLLGIKVPLLMVGFQVGG
jgi:hypothetical protein